MKKQLRELLGYFGKGFIKSFLITTSAVGMGEVGRVLSHTNEQGINVLAYPIGLTPLAYGAPDRTWKNAGSVPEEAPKKLYDEHRKPTKGQRWAYRAGAVAGVVGAGVLANNATTSHLRMALGGIAAATLATFSIISERLKERDYRLYSSAPGNPQTQAT